jgi:rhomboid protease GluP
MSLNDLLLWIGIGSPAAVVVISMLPGRVRDVPFIVTCLAVIALTGGCLLWRREVAGYVGGGIYLVLVTLPALVGIRVHSHQVAQRFHKAAQLSWWLNLCFPYLGWSRRASLFRGFDLAYRNQISAAEEIFNQLANNRSRDGRTAAWNRLRIRSRWPELRDWFSEPDVAAALDRDPTLVVMLLRTLGECGARNEMIKAFESFQKTLYQAGSFRDFSRLLVLSFAGRVVATRRLCETSLRKLPSAVRDFWVGTAEFAAGDALAARSRLEAIKALDGFSQLDVEWRLRSESPASPEMTREELGVVARVEGELASEGRVGIRSGTMVRRYGASSVLIAINVVVFLGAQLFGQAEEVNWWYAFGVLDTWGIHSYGQWWRLVTSIFLHLDIGHLLANMIALVFLGPFIESILGRWRFIALFFVAGIGSMAFVYRVHLNDGSPYLATGASGAIMGLTGAAGAIFFREWLGERARSVLSALRWVLVLMLIQFGVDLISPQISFAGHTSGFVIGFLVTSALLALKPKASGHQEATGTQVS